MRPHPVPDAAFRTPELATTCARLGIRLLVRFGSTVPGGLVPRPGSDVDVAAVFQPGADLISPGRLHMALEEALPDLKLDVVHLSHNADPLLRWEVMRAGACVYGDELDFLEYRAFAYRDFHDSEGLARVEGVLLERKLGWLAEAGRASA